MLVLEITIDPKKVNVFCEVNPWIDRASRSLSEALRLQTSKILDIEFIEINSGYRLRQESTCVHADIYMYDNLSSGAGYSSGIVSQIDGLLSATESFLNSCTCENACKNCLKHYRNQNYHSVLDRFAALDLLFWAKNGLVHPDIPLEKQFQKISPLRMILKDYNIDLIYRNNSLFVSSEGKSLQLCIYPSMKIMQSCANIVYVSDFEATYSRAYAVDSIRGAFGHI